MLYRENSQGFQTLDFIWYLAEFIPTEVEYLQPWETKDLQIREYRSAESSD